MLQENSEETVSRWISEISEFHESSTLSQRGYKRLMGGTLDSDDYDAYAREQAGCTAAIEILRSLEFPADIPEKELRQLAESALRAEGPSNPQQADRLFQGIVWAIAVVRGEPEPYYNAYHPRRKD